MNTQKNYTAIFEKYNTDIITKGLNIVFKNVRDELNNLIMKNWIVNTKRVDANVENIIGMLLYEQEISFMADLITDSVFTDSIFTNITFSLDSIELRRGIKIKYPEEKKILTGAIEPKRFLQIIQDYCVIENIEPASIMADRFFIIPKKDHNNSYVVSYQGKSTTIKLNKEEENE